MASCANLLDVEGFTILLEAQVQDWRLEFNSLRPTAPLVPDPLTTPRPGPGPPTTSHSHSERTNNRDPVKGSSPGTSCNGKATGNRAEVKVDQLRDYPMSAPCRPC